MSENRPLYEIFRYWNEPTPTEVDEVGEEQLQQFAAMGPNMTIEEMERHIHSIFEKKITIIEIKKFIDFKILQIEAPYANDFAQIKAKATLVLSDSDINSVIDGNSSYACLSVGMCKCIR